jgi:AcrR family transcriptional regulator
MAATPKAKLEPDDWLKAAFRALATEGLPALKVELLAPKLKATKGSFYWHFTDMVQFKQEMLRLWQHETTTAIVDELEQAPAAPAAKLQRLVVIIGTMNERNDYGGVAAEPAIRSWAQHDRQVETALRKVDDQRIAFVTSLFHAHGISTAEAALRGELFYTSFLGLQALAASRKVDIVGRLTTVLVALLKNKPDFI